MEDGLGDGAQSFSRILPIAHRVLQSSWIPQIRVKKHPSAEAGGWKNEKEEVPGSHGNGGQAAAATFPS